MKKSLLLGCLALAAGTVWAIEPQILTDRQIVAFSPDGKWAVSSLNGTMELISLDGEQNVLFEPDENYVNSYSEGLGNIMSNTGMLLASNSDAAKASYYQNGEWHVVETPDPKMHNMLNGVTPDGTRMCGSVGLAPIGLEDQKVPMLSPAVWDLQSDGTYKYTLLPCPATDFTGRVPNYITAVCISDDGKTIAGQINDYSGSISYPILYNLDDDGKWNYSIIGLDLVNPDHLEFPEWPGDGPQYPDMLDFLTEEEKAAYDKALEEWDGDYSHYPNVEDFLSAEGKAEFEKAVDEFEVAHDKWYEKSEAFNSVLEKIRETGALFVFNNIFLSPDAKRLGTTAAKAVEDPLSWFGYTNYEYPIIFNLEDDHAQVFDYNDNIRLSGMAEDYTLVGSTEENSGLRLAVICAPGADNFKSMMDFEKEFNPVVYDWLKENCFHDVLAIDPETWEEVILEDTECTGIPRTTRDLKTFALVAENLWDYDAQVYSYLFPSGTESSVGVKGIAAGESTLTPMRGGLIRVQGDVTRIIINDMTGRTVYNGVPSANMVSTNLPSGLYVVRGITASGRQIVAKTAF